MTEGLYEVKTSPIPTIGSATDQVTDQVRPKDLRDEFAMVALVGLTADPSSGYAYNSSQSYENGVSKRAYQIADAMMKARVK